jgi:hypothetical protein
MTVAKGMASVNNIRNYESRSELSHVVGAQQAIRIKHYLEDRSSMQLSTGSFNIGRNGLVVWRAAASLEHDHQG